MLDRIADIGTLNCIYFAMVIAGLVYAVGLLLLGEFGGNGDHGFDGGGDVDVDMDGGLLGDADLQIFSPITAATFVTVFGATGLVATLGFDVDSRISLLIAAVGGAIVSLMVGLAYSRLLVEMHGSTEIRQSDMIGMVGQVTTPIPSEGLGEVLYEIGGERGIKPARSSDRTPIARGTTVVVEEIVGGELIVRARHP